MKLVFPGSFDPFTRGHEHLVKRALGLFQEIIIAVGSSSKTGWCPISKRVELIQKFYEHQPRVSVIAFEGLLVNTVRKLNAKAILRGLRQTDFNYEMSMALMNRRLAPDIETLFLCADQEFLHISSSLVREVLIAGGSIEDDVPEGIAEHYMQVKFSSNFTSSM